MAIFRFMIFILSTEILLGIFYYVITPKTIRKNKLIDYKSLLKGIVERIFLLVSMINDYPHALALFGALKLATRLKRDDEQDKVKQSLYNDFYLVGNFISVMIAIFYVFLHHKYIG
ncbi:hypothetical protein [Flavobacterium sp. LB2P6]|uniref:hypothetical protein n=1 Tax=Flavobacterium sp. LB2P6 TaxID=3401714 RepID=UPI003AAA4892